MHDCRRLVNGNEDFPPGSPEFALVLGGPDRRTLFICTAEWHRADDHVANLERLANGPRTGTILAVPVDVPGAGRDSKPACGRRPALA
jgi:sugar lactone lactonase YvrE